jgi:hypothetical protein
MRPNVASLYFGIILAPTNDVASFFSDNLLKIGQAEKSLVMHEKMICMGFSLISYHKGSLFLKL